MYYGWAFPILLLPVFLVSLALAFFISGRLNATPKKSEKPPNLSRTAAAIGIAAITIGSAAFAYGAVFYLENRLTPPETSVSDGIPLMVFGLAIGLVGGILLGLGDWSILRVFTHPHKTQVNH